MADVTVESDINLVVGHPPDLGSPLKIFGLKKGMHVNLRFGGL